MIAPRSFVERHRYQLLALTAVWTMSGVIAYLWAPLMAPALLLLCVVAPVSWWLLTRPGIPLQSPSAVTIALIVACGYLSINASWSLSPSTARFALIMLLLFVAALHITLHALEGSDADANRAMALALYAGVAIAGAVVCLEVLTQQWIRRHLMSIWPAFRPDQKHIAVVEGWVAYLQPYLLNRSIAAMTLLLWPAVLAAVLLAPESRRQRWLLAGLIPVVGAILGSKHETSKIALVGAIATFGFFQIWPAATKRTVFWAWGAIILLVVPLATLAYQSEIYLSSWLPPSAQHRIVIWGHTSRQIADKPILGAGIHSARALNDPHGYDAPLAPGSAFRLTTSLHSHNGYLQTWYEAGAVGAILLLIVGILVLHSLVGAPARVQPFLYATFVTCALMGGSSFSLWQPWFMAALGLAAVFATLGWAIAAQDEKAGAVG